MIYGCDAVWSLFQYKGDTKTEVEKHNLMLQFQMYEDFSGDLIRPLGANAPRRPGGLSRRNGGPGRGDIGTVN